MLGKAGSAPALLLDLLDGGSKGRGSTSKAKWSASPSYSPTMLRSSEKLQLLLSSCGKQQPHVSTCSVTEPSSKGGACKDIRVLAQVRKDRSKDFDRSRIASLAMAFSLSGWRGKILHQVRTDGLHCSPYPTLPSCRTG